MLDKAAKEPGRPFDDHMALRSLQQREAMAGLSYVRGE